MKRLVVFAIVVLSAVSVDAKRADRTTEIKFDDVAADLFLLENNLADTENFLFDLTKKYSETDRAVEPVEFGSWEVHGGLRPSGNGFFGDDLQCRFGTESFVCAGQVVIETGVADRIFTGLILQAQSVAIDNFFPAWAKNMEASLGQLPMGRARIGLVRSIGPRGDSVLHRYDVFWTSKGGRVERDTSLLGAALTKMMLSQSEPFRSDAKLRSWKVVESTVALKYFPRFYSPEKAAKHFGSDRSLQEMIVSFDVLVEVQHHFLFLQTPHRYRIRITGLPLRFFEIQ